MRKIITNLNMEPVSYIICLHVRNMRGTAGISNNAITDIMSNLELTYGPDAVEDTVRDFFPNFYAKYYDVPGSTGDTSHNAATTGDLDQTADTATGKPSKNDLKWNKLIKKLDIKVK